jgi:1-deoxy-D-xylulose-5-phosphate reductoisomerase
VDGSILVQMGAPDMHGPIQYAMTWPERLPNSEPGVHLDLLSLSRLHLEPPDLQRFPCIRLAYEAGKQGSGATAVLNSADEMAVQLFLEEKIAFRDIARLLENALDAYARENTSLKPTLDEVQHLDAWARRYVQEQALKSTPLPVASH